MECQQSNSGLQVQGLKVDFKVGAGRIQAVKGVDILVKRGLITALVGESGSGKSVTAFSIMGLLAENGFKTGGQITIDGKPPGVRGKRQKKKSGALVGMIFQDPAESLNPLYTVGSQMMEGMIYHQQISKAQAWEKSIAHLKALHLQNPEHLMGKYPFELSGGMCQRVMIAIAMSLEPKYLIADEPTTALDVTVQKQILSELHGMSREKQMGVLLITHDLGVVAEVADEVYVMQNGRVVESGDVYKVFQNPGSTYTRNLLNAIL